MKRMCKCLLLVVVLNTIVWGQERSGPWTSENMLNVKLIADVQVSPDGKETLFTTQEKRTAIDGGGTSCVLHLSTNATRDSVLLTTSSICATSPRWSPDGSLIAFIADRSDKRDIWMVRADGGESWQVTMAGNVSGFKWSPKGDAIAFIGPAVITPLPDSPKVIEFGGEDPPNQLWLVRVDVSREPRPARQITSLPYNINSSPVGNSGLLGDIDWSPSGDEIAFTHTPTGSLDDWPKADISIVNIHSGTVRPFAVTQASEIGPMYSPDGRWIAYLASDSPPTWGRDYRVRVASSDGAGSRDLSATFDRQPVLLGWSAKGNEIIVTETLGTAVAAYALPFSGGAIRVLTQSGLDEWSNTINPTRTHVGFVCQGPDTPPEACVSPLNHFESRKVSRVNESRMLVGRTERIKWRSLDGLLIEGLLTYPVEYHAGGRYPLLVVLHGGPVGSCLETYTASPAFFPVAVFASRGYAVLCPNFRGSSGYGRRFRYLNMRDWISGANDDVMSGVDKVIRMGVADGDKLGLMGWSYGGYLASMILTKTPRFKAASIGAAPSDLTSHSLTTDLPGFIPAYMGGQAWNVPDTYQRRSPVYRVKTIVTPLLIQHGERDTRVRVEQAQELFFALQRTGHRVQLLTYPGVGHAPWDLDDISEMAQHNCNWFDTHIETHTH